MSNIDAKAKVLVKRMATKLDGETKAPRRTQSERRDSTRRLILDAAVDVMAQHGVGGLRMEDVEQRASVSRGALLHHFGTKGALILATFEDVNERSLERSQQRTQFAQRAGSVAEVVDAILADAFEFFFGQGFFVELSLGFGQGYHELRKAVRRMSRKSRFAVEAAWLCALESRGLNKSVAEDILSLTLNQVRGFMVRRFMDNDPQQRARLVSVWQDMVRAYLTERLNGELPAAEASASADSAGADKASGRAAGRRKPESKTTKKKRV